MFRAANWGRASTTSNEPLTTLQSAAITGCFKTYNYYAQAAPAGDGDTQATIAAASYFDAVNFDLQTGDVIFAESAQDQTVVTYLVTNTAGVITTTAFNYGAGAIGTPNILDGAVTYAKIQNVAASSLMGNPTGAPAAPTDVGMGNGLTFTAGALAIRDSYLNYATGNITAAQWNAMYGAPQLIIPAPGANKMIIIEEFLLNMSFVTTQYAAGGAVQIQYGNTVHAGGVNAGGATIAAATINGLAASSAIGINNFTAVTATATAINAALYLTNATAAFTTGDSTWTWQCWYRIVNAL